MYELRMTIHQIIFIREKALDNAELCVYLPYLNYTLRMASLCVAYEMRMSSVSQSPYVWGKFHLWRNLSDMARHSSGVVGQFISSGMYSSMMAWQASLTIRILVFPPSIRTSWLNACSQRQGRVESVRASVQVSGYPCTRCVVWWPWDPLWLAAHPTSRGHPHEVREGSLVLVS